MLCNVIEVVNCCSLLLIVLAQMGDNLGIFTYDGRGFVLFDLIYCRRTDGVSGIV